MQRQGVAARDLGDDPIIQPGDVLHCDVGITVARLSTDTQHLAYVLKRDSTVLPAGFRLSRYRKPAPGPDGRGAGRGASSSCSMFAIAFFVRS